MRSDKEENQINWLTIVRVVATIMVVIVHFGQSLPLPDCLLSPILFCQTAVCAFFILTGYFTAASLDYSKSKKYYYRKRIARIAPVYYTVVIINAIASLFIGGYPEDITHLGWLRFITFTNGIIPSNDYSYWNNGAALWTMSSFCIFYIIAPFTRKWFNTYKTSVIAIMGGGIACN